MTHVTRGRKSSISSCGFPIECSRTLDSLNRLMALPQSAPKVLVLQHRREALLTRLSQAWGNPAWATRRAHLFEFRLKNQRRLPSTKQPCWGTGCPRTPAPNSELNLSHQTGCPFPHGGCPFPPVRSCNNTDLKGSWARLHPLPRL